MKGALHVVGASVGPFVEVISDLLTGFVMFSDFCAVFFLVILTHIFPGLGIRAFRNPSASH